MRSVWHPCSQMKQFESLPLVPVAKAEGMWLFDFDGRRYLDAISSWWVNLFGHCNPRINKAIQEQLGTLEHVILAGFTHEPVIRLSERLAALTGLGHCFYASDGASATEIALKMSFHYWREHGRSEKNRFVSLQNAYHGETVGALAVTDIPLFTETYAPLLRRGDTVPTPDWRLAEPGVSPREHAIRRANDLRAHLAAHHEQTAAFIIEPMIQGAAGMAMHDAEYLRLAREICDEFDVHLIADEIAVGFGRSGTLFACEQAGIRPDFLCLSKGITGGYLPLSVVLTTDAVYQTFYHEETARGFLHSHSYTGNALACRAALATLDIFEQDQVIVTNQAKGAMIDHASEALRHHPKIRNFRRTGMVWAFEVASAHPQFSSAFYQLALQQELLLRPIGKTVYFMPPYIINDEEADLLVAGTLKVLDQLC